MTATTAPTTVAFGLATLDASGRMTFNLHAGQSRAHLSTKRFILVLAGTQSGKTVYGPLWLHREIQECGPGDYMIVAPSLTLMNLKAKPAFDMLFETILHLGKTKKENNRDVFYFSEEGSRRMFGTYDAKTPTRILFGFAAKPDTLEAATLKAVWCDEAGQDDFVVGAWQAIQRRLSIAQGRVLFTTTPYNLGWLKTELHDPALAGDPDIELVQFDSLENPVFPRAEYERAERTLPRWLFNMMYKGLFERPVGLIYDCFNPTLHVVSAARTKIDPTWPRLVGLDFGLVNFAALIYARDPSVNRYYLYHEYHGEGFTMRTHVQEVLKHIPQRADGTRPRIRAIGGAFSEDQWRTETTNAGLAVERPDQRDVEVGITRVYGVHRRNEILVLDSCRGYLDQKGSYRRVLDRDTNEPTQEIANKNRFHWMDCERYAIGTAVKGVESTRNVRAKRRVRFN
jgi:hypothetical protein